MAKRTKRMNGQASGGEVGYVKGSAEPGMFEDELLVFVEGIDPEQPGKQITVQVLVDSDLVRVTSGHPERGNPAPCQLKVGVVRVERGVATVVLPQPGIPVGESMLVSEAALAR